MRKIKFVAIILIGIAIGIFGRPFLDEIGVAHAEPPPPEGLFNGYSNDEPVFVYEEKTTESNIRHRFRKNEQLYIHYCEDGFCFVEKYYDCVQYSIFGWSQERFISYD